jgi:hypothetical protein
VTPPLEGVPSTQDMSNGADFAAFGSLLGEEFLRLKYDVSVSLLAKLSFYTPIGESGFFAVVEKTTPALLAAEIGTHALLAADSSRGRPFLFSQKEFLKAWLDEAQKVLAERRARLAFRFFREEELAKFDGPLFLEELLKREAEVAQDRISRWQREGLLPGPGEVSMVESARRSLARRWLWERLTRALPVAFLLAAAFLAVSMALRLI